MAKDKPHKVEDWIIESQKTGLSYAELQVKDTCAMLKREEQMRIKKHQRELMMQSKKI